MTRLNLILFVALILIALGTVTAQHQSRKLYFELQQQQDAAKQYAIEWGQLQLEQSTWAMHARIEHIAAKQLQMQVPDAKRIQVVSAESLHTALPVSGTGPTISGPAVTGSVVSGVNP